MIDPNKAKITVNGREIEPCGELQKIKYSHETDDLQTTTIINEREIHSGLFNKPQEANHDKPRFDTAEDVLNFLEDISLKLDKQSPYDPTKAFVVIKVEEWKQEGSINAIPLLRLNDFIDGKRDSNKELRDSNGNLFRLVARIRKSNPSIIYLEVADD